MNEKILITGATGLLGSATALEISQYHPGADLLFLVRSETQEDGLDRIKQACIKVGANNAFLSRLTVEQILCGELGTADGFAIDPRLADVTHVVNCAALTSFANRPAIHKINVDDTLVFARMVSKLPSVRRFLYIGTAMICGDTPNRLIHEDEYPSLTHHFVPYTASKSAAEIKLPDALGNVQLIVARPSIVVGHTQLGCTPSSSIYWVFRMFCEAWRSLCPLDYTIDVLPVDYVAQAITYLLLKDDLKYSRYHIAAGRQGSCSFLEIANTYNQHSSSPRTELPTESSVDELARNLEQFNEWFGPGNPRMMLRAMRLYNNFASLNVVFDNSRLVSEGFPASPRFIEYLPECMKTGSSQPIMEQMADDFK